MLSKYRSHVPNLFEPFQKYTWDVWIRNEGNVEVTYEGFEILTKTRDAREFLVWEDRPRPVTLKVTEDFKKIHIRFSSETLRQGLFRVTVRFRFRQGVRTHVFEVIKKKKKKRYVVRDWDCCVQNVVDEFFFSEIKLFFWTDPALFSITLTCISCTVDAAFDRSRSIFNNLSHCWSTKGALSGLFLDTLFLYSWYCFCVVQGR